MKFSSLPREVRETIDRERGRHELKFVSEVRRDGRKFYRAVIDERKGDKMIRVGLEGRLLEDRVEQLLSTVACHSVVRAGTVLGEPAVRALLASLDGVDHRSHCPHGRPVLLRLSLGELERRFTRP